MICCNLKSFSFLFVLQIVRIQSPEHGTKRIETKGSESIAEFLNKVWYWDSNASIGGH